MSKRMVDIKVEDGKVTSIDGFELAGGNGSSGGNYNVKVTSAKYETGYKSGVTPQWNGGSGLQANTAYNVGDQVQMYIRAIFNSKSVGPNQTLAVSAANLIVSLDQAKLQYGDVILVLTNTNTISSLLTAVNNQSYQFQCESYLIYTVVKAGTTGANVTPPSSGFDASIKYMISTLEITQATE